MPKHETFTYSGSFVFDGLSDAVDADKKQAESTLFDATFNITNIRELIKVNGLLSTKETIQRSFHTALNEALAKTKV